MNATIAFAMCGSFCTFERALDEAQRLVENGARLVPVMSTAAARTDTRFGSSAAFRARLAQLGSAALIDTVAAAEPLGPRGLAQALLVAPCTGNTLGKLACGITDTPVVMAAKSLLRTGRPVILALSTNDGLSASLQNIGRLMNTKNIYFGPFRQDDPLRKPCSLQADFSLLERAVESALAGRQLQPVLLAAQGGVHG